MGGCVWLRAAAGRSDMPGLPCVSSDLSEWRAVTPAKVAGQRSANPWLSLHRLDHNQRGVTALVSLWLRFLLHFLYFSEEIYFVTGSRLFFGLDLTSFISFHPHLLCGPFGPHMMCVCVCVMRRRFPLGKTRSNLLHLLDLDCDEGGVRPPGRNRTDVPDVLLNEAESRLGRRARNGRASPVKVEQQPRGFPGRRWEGRTKQAVN